MTLYKKKYRVETARLQNHGYDEGVYFVTICTKKKMQWFGEVKNRKMFTLRSKTLGSVMNQLKGTVTKRVWAAGYRDFRWQHRCHDRIIRSKKELVATKKYIASSPMHGTKKQFRGMLTPLPSIYEKNPHPRRHSGRDWQEG